MKSVPQEGSRVLLSGNSRLKIINSIFDYADINYTDINHTDKHLPQKTSLISVSKTRFLIRTLMYALDKLMNSHQHILYFTK